MSFNKPTTADEFVAFMEEVWRMDTRPGPDGGVILSGSDLYDEYHDAIKSARRFGAWRTGGTNLRGHKTSHLYRFPADHDLAGVRISNDGSACEVSYHRFTPKGVITS